MERHDALTMKGALRFQLFGADGALKREWSAKNTVTALGDAHVADQLSDQGNAAMSHMAAGSGTGGTTTLNSEEGRVALDSTTQGAAGDDNDVIYVATFPAGTATAALTEAGVFNDASAGVLFVYATFAAINKGAADSLVITWTLTCGAT